MQVFLTVKVDSSDVVQQQASLYGVHVAADTMVAGTQVLVHVVESVGNGVDGIDHKLNLPLLLIGRVLTDPLVTCGDMLTG